jgi:hypothetical protein
MRTLSAFSVLLIPALLCAQETVAPTVGESTMSPRGEDAGNYNIVQNWEFGYRFASIGGNEGKYRSDVNYRNGVRLLSSYLTVNSRDGRGGWFDEIVLTTQGLGTDPYQSATFRIQKNRLYRYDMLWRLNDYFNPGLTIDTGEHFEDTTYRIQDHDITLFPQSWLRGRAGFSQTTQNGPALTTAQEFDGTSDAFPLFRNTRQTYNEYRAGAEIFLKSFRFTVLRRWEFFKDDTTDIQTAVQGSGIAGDPNTLNSFRRTQPYRGRTPGWLVTVYGEHKWFAANGRFTYSGGRGNFVQNETAVGISRLGTGQNVQDVISGNADRPVITGDLNLTVSPTSRLSFTNNTSVSNVRVSGNNLFEQFNNSTFTSELVNFQFLGILLITNSTDVHYRFSKKFDAFAGYRYADRQVRSIEAAVAPGPTFNTTASQTNLLHAGVAGFSWIPLADLRVHVEGEVGNNDHPFAPISLGKYHAIRSRVLYRKKAYTLGAGYEENYNNNSIVITAFSSRLRNYTANASWNAKSWLSVDASYSKLHLDTLGGLSFFAGAPPVSFDATSVFISNIHAANLGLRFPVTSRADLYVGYNITKDTGDGRASAVPNPSTPVANLLAGVQTFPLTYQSPLVRVSVKISQKLRYNLGYQYYGYHEEFGLFQTNQNYRAHTGYTSLLWSF